MGLPWTPLTYMDYRLRLRFRLWMGRSWLLPRNYSTRNRRGTVTGSGKSGCPSCCMSGMMSGTSSAGECIPETLAKHELSAG